MASHDIDTRSVAESIPPFVDRAWVDAAAAEAPPEQVLTDGRLVICDVRSSMTAPNPVADFAAGHVPGAVFIDLETDLTAAAGSAPDSTPGSDPFPGRHPLPTPKEFAATLTRAGIGVDDIVVAYDAGVGAFAARLVWMLRVIGQRAAVLDGGLADWAGELEQGQPGQPTRTVDRPVAPWPVHAMADAAEVAAHLERGGVVVDSREAVRYRGEQEPIDPVAGHVPGAINLPFQGNLDMASGSARLRTNESLADRFRPLADDSNAIVYCGSGVTACHNVLAAEHIGLQRPRLYVGSWSGWTSDPERPVGTV